MSVVDELRRRIQVARRDHPAIERLLLMQEHYGRVGAGQQAGAVTYFGFLSIFPILALAVFVVGWIAHLYPDAESTLTDAINQVMPGLVGGEKGQLSLDDVQRFTGWAAAIGIVGVLYAGLGWLSSLRTALEIVFCVPRAARPNFLLGKARDLLTLVILGIVLFLAVAVTGFVAGFAGDVLDWIGLSTSLGWLVILVTIVLGLAANAVLFFAMFVLLAEPPTPRPSLWAGSCLGAVCFEILKQLSSLLLGAAKGQPAFQAFGIALILLVWINYFSRVVLYAAAFAHVSPAARAQQAAAYDVAPVQGPQTPPIAVTETAAPPVRSPGPVAAFVAGAGTMVAALAVLTKIRKRNT